MDPTRISGDSEAMHQSQRSFAYDRVAYPGLPDDCINLRNLEVAGAMFGLQPTELSRCRVLELGCADGTNLLPFALEFPESHFVGIDLAGDRIIQANDVANEVGLRNVDFHHASVSDIEPSLDAVSQGSSVGATASTRSDGRVRSGAVPFIRRIRV
jgi:2-polyprenyl-3-methyl-5-hydroxy-6-metoxy-1,4-benzoquinol methylase